MYYLIKDIEAWREKISLKRGKLVAFVSKGFVGEERKRFDSMFDQFASAYYKKVIFLYVDVDRDDLRQVFEEISNGMDIFPTVAAYDSEGNVIKSEINPPPKRFRDLVKMAVMATAGKTPFVTVTDKSHWEEIIGKAMPKAVACVSNYFKGKEREAFDRMFREFAKAHKDKILFAYIVCDYDELWDVYDQLKPGGLHIIPLVATLDISGTPMEAYVNPSPIRFREMLKRLVETEPPEEVTDENVNKEDNDD
jgi:hypothetical protein